MSELEDYVEKVRAQGFKDAQIREQLLKHGYDEKTVDMVLGKKAKPPQKKRIFLLLVPLIVVIVVGVYLGSEFLKPQVSCGAQIGFFELDGQPFICQYDDKVQMMLINSGNHVSKLEVKIHGRGTQTHTLENVALGNGEALTVNLDTDVGEIESLEIIPGNAEQMCRLDSLEIADIRPC